MKNVGHVVRSFKLISIYSYSHFNLHGKPPKSKLLNGHYILYDSLKELRNYNWKLFLRLPQKEAENTTNILKHCFFERKYNMLHQPKYLNIETYVFRNSVYLVFLPLENAKKTQTDQSMLRVSLLCLKKTTHKPIKVAAAKNLFSSRYVFGSTYFDECFLFHMITGKQYFHKSLSLLWNIFPWGFL